MHFSSFSKAALPRGQGLAAITVSGRLTVTAARVCFGVEGGSCPAPTTCVQTFTNRLLLSFS